MRGRLTLIPTLLALAIAIPLAGCGDGSSNDNIFIGTTPTPGGGRTPTPARTSTPQAEASATATAVEGATPTETPTAGTEPTATVTPSGAACPAGGMIVVTESVDKDFGGLKTELKYPASVTIPGSGSATDKTRITGTPSGGLLQVNDAPTTSGIDDTLTLGFVDTNDHPAGQFAIVTFDCVEGSPAPALGEFTCTVASASTGGGNTITDATCSLSISGP
jgi:hypothetical protein